MRRGKFRTWTDMEAERLIPQDDPLRILYEGMNLGFIYELVKDRYTYHGKQGFDPVCMIRALLLIPLGYAESVRDLAEKLRYDIRLSYLCGFDKDNTPAHNTFSKFKARLGSELFLRIMTQAIAKTLAFIKARSLKLVVDATHLESKFRKSDPDARWGCKSERYIFYGYKVHITITDTDPPIPVAVEITPGNVHDGVVLRDMVEKIPGTRRIKALVADSAYESRENGQLLLDKGIAPMIGHNPRSQKEPVRRGDVFFTPKGEFICMAGHELVYHGYDKTRKRYRFRCPFHDEKENACVYSPACGKNLYYIEEDEVADRMNTMRATVAFKKSFGPARSRIERQNSFLKNLCHMKRLLVRGKERVSIHVYLSVLAYLMRAYVGLKRGNKGLAPCR